MYISKSFLFDQLAYSDKILDSLTVFKCSKKKQMSYNEHETKTINPFMDQIPFFVVFRDIA